MWGKENNRKNNKQTKLFWGKALLKVQVVRLLVVLVLYIGQNPCKNNSKNLSLKKMCVIKIWLCHTNLKHPTQIYLKKKNFFVRLLVEKHSLEQHMGAFSKKQIVKGGFRILWQIYHLQSSQNCNLLLNCNSSHLLAGKPMPHF